MDFAVASCTTRPTSQRNSTHLAPPLAIAHAVSRTHVVAKSESVDVEAIERERDAVARWEAAKARLEKEHSATFPYCLAIALTAILLTIDHDLGLRPCGGEVLPREQKRLIRWTEWQCRLPAPIVVRF